MSVDERVDKKAAVLVHLRAAPKVVATVDKLVAQLADVKVVK